VRGSHSVLKNSPGGLVSTPLLGRMRPSILIHFGYIAKTQGATLAVCFFRLCGFRFYLNLIPVVNRYADLEDSQDCFQSSIPAFLFAHLTLIEDGRYSSFAAKNDSPRRQARTQYGHILGTKTYHLAPDGTTTQIRVPLICQQLTMILNRLADWKAALKRPASAVQSRLWPPPLLRTPFVASCLSKISTSPDTLRMVPSRNALA